MTWLSRVAHGALLSALTSACTTATPVDAATTGTSARASVASSTAVSTPTSGFSSAVPAISSPAATSSPRAISSTATAETLAPSPCPNDMVAVVGQYCTRYELKCLRRRKPWQCAEYDEPGSCKGPEVPKRFCIDRYEYPNQKGAIATVMNSWSGAKKQCQALGKRLCTDAEWTLACEGPDRLAFPYGYLRDSGACAIDKKSPKVNEGRLFWKKTQAEEVARLDQREPSGSRERCVSGFGVHDLTGNVDEWVVNETGRPFRSALKGGNWGEYRNACRPTTRGHDEGFYYYQTGFRCCQDLPPAD